MVTTAPTPATPSYAWVRRLLSIEAVWVLLAVAGPFALAVSNPLRWDIWWVLKSGELIAAAGRLPTTDTLTFAPHTPTFVNPQWLAHLFYYGLSRWFGLEGVALGNAVVVTATFGLVFHLAWRRGQSIRLAAACTLLATAVAASNLNPRAQTLGFLLFTLSFWVLVCGRPGIRSLAALAGTEVAWANTHGSFFLGPGLTALLLAGGAVDVVVGRGWRALTRAPRLRFYAAALAVQTLAMLATPYGFGLFDYVRGIVSDPIIRQFIAEWWPTAALRDAAWTRFVASLLLSGAALGYAAWTRRLNATDAVLLLAFAALALQAARNVAWWALVMAPVLAGHLALVPVPRGLRPQTAPPDTASPGRLGMNAVLVGFLALALASLLPWVKEANPLLPAAQRGLIALEEPQAAASFLLSQPLPPRILSAQHWGAYLTWRLWPRYHTLLDGRIEIYPADVWRDYAAIHFGQASWQERIDRYAVDLLVLSKAYQPDLIALVSASSRWQQLYADDLAVIFGRSDDRSRPAVSPY
ncbi:MAG: hypothetical protein HY689_06415 [Chloroflexi bacterium]|nr:hypothetical protein [Chloroflexota bacterium]